MKRKATSSSSSSESSNSSVDHTDKKAHTETNSTGTSNSSPSTSTSAASNESAHSNQSSFTDSMFQNGTGIRVYGSSATGYAANSEKDKKNQDRWIYKLGLRDSPVHLFGVADGHGAVGEVVSGWVSQHLPLILAEDKRVHDRPIKTVAPAIRKITSRMKKDKSITVDISKSGSTLVFGLLSGQKLVIANVGDSRCVMAKRQEGKLVAVQLTRDHSPDDPEEKKRIVAAGGRVGVTAPGQPFRIFQGQYQHPHPRPCPHPRHTHVHVHVHVHIHIYIHFLFLLHLYPHSHDVQHRHYYINRMTILVPQPSIVEE